MKKQFHNKRHFYLHIEPFKVDVLFAINTTGAETIAFLKKSADKNKIPKDHDKLFKNWESDLTVEGRTIIFAGGFIVLLKANPNQFRQFVGILTHEVTHVIHHMLRDRRINLTRTTEEIYTYHIESLLYKALCEIY